MSVNPREDGVRPYYRELILTLQSLDDDLDTNLAPREAILMAQQLFLLCRDDYIKKYGLDFRSDV